MSMVEIRRNNKSNIINLAGLFAAFIVIVVLSESGVLSNYIKGIMISSCIAIIMATSLNIATGFLGQIALGHAGFMAVGAYTAALITKAMAMEGILTSNGFEDIIRFLIGTLAGGMLAGVTGFLVGIPALRLRGDYLAIITLGFGEIIRVIIQNLPFAGGKGLAEGQPGQALIGIDRIANIYIVFWLTAICVAVLYSFVRSRYGRAILAIREDDIGSAASGINNTKYKVIAFTLSAFFAGVAGGIYAHYIGSLATNVFAFLKSTEYVIMVVFGGMGSLTGSVVAAVALSVLPEALRTFSDYRMLVYSVALILVMIFKPTGLFGTYEFSLTRVFDKVRGRKLKDNDKERCHNERINIKN